MAIKELICYCIAAYVVLMIFGFYTVKEGNVGLLKNWGVLKKDLVEPGFHFRIPGYQQVLAMNLMIQTDLVQDVPCGTANGLLIHFKRIEVVNRLQKKHVYKTVLNYTEEYQNIWITDKIHHQINQFCSQHTLQEIYIDLFDKLDQALMKALDKDLKKWAPGIEILSVRATKPTIPKSILNNVEEMEKIKVEYLIAMEREKVQIEQRITNQTQRKIKAESRLAVAEIDLEKQLQQKQNELAMAQIEAKIVYERETTKTDNQLAAAFQQAALYSTLYTPEHLTLLATEALTQNLTLITGSKVPTFYPSWFQK